MNACTSTSQWERTLKLHSEMVERGVEPDVLTWNSLMQARSNLADDPIDVLHPFYLSLCRRAKCCGARIPFGETRTQAL